MSYAMTIRRVFRGREVLTGDFLGLFPGTADVLPAFVPIERADWSEIPQAPGRHADLTG